MVGGAAAVEAEGKTADCWELPMACRLGGAAEKALADCCKCCDICCIVNNGCEDPAGAAVVGSNAPAAEAKVDAGAALMPLTRAIECNC